MFILKQVLLRFRQLKNSVHMTKHAIFAGEFISNQCDGCAEISIHKSHFFCLPVSALENTSNILCLFCGLFWLYKKGLRITFEVVFPLVEEAGEVVSIIRKILEVYLMHLKRKKERIRKFEYNVIY